MHVGFPPRRLARAARLPALPSPPPAAPNEPARVLFTEKVPQRVPFELQQEGEKGRAKGTLLLPPRRRRLHPDQLRKLPLFSLPLSGP